jgi:hypothetical protein
MHQSEEILEQIDIVVTASVRKPSLPAKAAQNSAA